MSTRRPPKKKICIMQSSGQTDQERRNLRHSQRQLQREIQTSAAIENPDSTAFDDIRQSNNKLFGEVRFAREAVLDGENLDLISSKAARQVDKLVQVPRYDAVKLAKKLTSKCGVRGKVDWEVLGREACKCFNAVPPHVAFFHGAMESEYVPKHRVVRQRRKQTQEDDEDEEENDGQKDKNDPTAAADKLSAVEKHMKEIGKALSKRCKEELSTKIEALEQSSEWSELDDKSKEKRIKRLKKDGICAVQYMFNPKSFTQTVENIFHFSFLVKKGDAAIKVVQEEDGTKRPIVRAVATRSANPPEPRQTIVSLTMKDWRNMCDAFGVQKCDIPHRTGSRHAAAATNSSRSPRTPGSAARGSRMPGS